MKKIPGLFLVYFFIPFLLTAQTRVLDIGEVPVLQRAFCHADADGKVLVSGAWEDAAKQLSYLADSFALAAGWPLTQAGNTKLGGISCNLDADEAEEILFNIGQKTYAWKADGTPVPGWPKSLSLYPDGPPAFGDIDGDGFGEVVVVTRSSGTANTGIIHAFRADGTVVTGFPVTLGGGITNNPCLADIDNNGAMEIIVTERNYPNGYVGVYKGDGSVYPGWPQQMDYIPGSACAAGDIDNDGLKEIIAESYYKIWAWEPDGTPVTGFPFTPGPNRVFSYSTPVLADLDGDGFREILAGDHSLSAGNGLLHVLKNDGTPLPGWPQAMGYWIYSPPSVGDIDSDGFPDVAIGDQVLSGSPVDQLAAWNASGIPLPGFPVNFLNAINCQVILADLDGDNAVELLFDDNTGAGNFHAYNHDGTVMNMPGWPPAISGQPFYMNPFVTDLDRDNLLEMVVSTYNSTTTQSNAYLWNNTVTWNPSLAYLPMLQYNTMHDGVFPQNLPVGTGPSLSVPDRIYAYPNPFSRELNLKFNTPIEGPVRLRLKDLHGAEIAVYDNELETEPGGLLTLPIDARNLPAGCYFLHLEARNINRTIKIIRLQ